MSCMSSTLSLISSFVSRANSARWFGVLAITAAIFSSACGGGGTGSPPVSSPPPPQPTGPGAPAIDEPGGIPAGFHLVWADEFDAAGLPDDNKWAYDIDRNFAGWYNNELQYYANARAENSRVENGSLIITARREDLSTLGLTDWGGQLYSSARLVTRGKAAWTYGRIEIRAKLPQGQGTWPAIWMLPEQNDYGTWAASGVSPTRIVRRARSPGVGGSGVGETDTSARVYGFCGVRMTCSAAPISMILPRYITAIRSAMTQASDRSWVMNR